MQVGFCRPTFGWAKHEPQSFSALSHYNNLFRRKKNPFSGFGAMRKRTQGRKEKRKVEKYREAKRQDNLTEKE
jgi:hypothetical protein